MQPAGDYNYLPKLSAYNSSPSTVLAESETETIKFSGVPGFSAFSGQFSSSLGLITLADPIYTDPSIRAEYDTFTTTLGASPVPEPSSVVLLGTGLLGVAGAVRRRFS